MLINVDGFIKIEKCIKMVLFNKKSAEKKFYLTSALKKP